jgi:hypothetical protein
MDMGELKNQYFLDMSFRYAEKSTWKKGFSFGF